MHFKSIYWPHQGVHCTEKWLQKCFWSHKGWLFLRIKSHKGRLWEKKKSHKGYIHIWVLNLRHTLSEKFQFHIISYPLQNVEYLLLRARPFGNIGGGGRKGSLIKNKVYGSMMSNLNTLYDEWTIFFNLLEGGGFRNKNTVYGG